MRHRFAPYLAFCVVFLASSTAGAQSWDPFPEINRVQRAGIIKRYDSSRYNDLRRCLRRFDSRVGADYYAAIVDVTDEAGTRSRDANDATPYAEALAQEWASEVDMDLDDHILIVIGVQNRSLGIDVGSEWEKVGFTGETVTDTVEASEYPREMRRRNYGEAICALATAIDFRLAALRQTMERRIKEVGATFPEVEAELAELREQVEQAFADNPSYAEGVRSDLEVATRALEEAKEKLEEDPASSVQNVDRARESMASARADLRTYLDSVKVLNEISNEIDTLDAEIAARSDVDRAGPTEAAELLDTCRQRLEQIRDTLEGEPTEVRVCVAEVRGKLAAADVRREYQSGIIPTIFAVFFILVVIAIVLALFVARRRTLRLLDPDLDEWKRRLSTARAELTRLVERYPDYFEMGDVAWTGESAELDARTADAVSRAFFLHGAGEKLHSEARKKRDGGHPLSVFPPTRAARLLRETETTLPAGSKVEGSPLTVPTTTSYTQPSAHLLGDLNDALSESERLLSQSASVLERLAKARAAGDAAEAETVAAVEKRRALKLSAEHLVGSLEQARQTWARAKRLTSEDPLRSDRDEVLDRARESLEELRDRAVGGNEAVAFIRGDLSQRISSIRHAIAQLKGEGVQLEEQNFDAAAELEAVKADARHALEKISNGEERRAIPAVDELDERSSELVTKIEVADEARTLVPVMADAIDELREAIRADLLKLRIGIGKLPEGTIPKDELDELMAFQTTLGRVNGELSRLRKSHASQNFLAAVAHVHRLIALLERGASLVRDLAARSGIELANTPTTIAWPDSWRDSVASEWEAEGFGGSKASRSLF